jgi:hypothetical protein
MKKLFLTLLVILTTVFALNANTNNFAANAKYRPSNSNLSKIDSIKKEAIDAYKSQKEFEYDSLKLSKLTGQQIYELDRLKHPVYRQNHLNEMAPFFLFLLLFAAFIFIVRSFLQRKKESQIFSLYEKAIEAGKDLPESLFITSLEVPKKSSNYLLNGLIWLGVGIGTSVGLYVTTSWYYDIDQTIKQRPDSPWPFGLIPIFVGFAYLITYFAEKKAKEKVQP